MEGVRNWFLAAAAYNIGGILLFSKALTNDALFAADPVMFSPMGCVLVIVWGLAYGAQSLTWEKAPLISAVFALEKLVYGMWWLLWLRSHDLAPLFERDALAGSFYSCYGAGDFAFAVFFAWAAFKAGGGQKAMAK